MKKLTLPKEPAYEDGFFDLDNLLHCTNVTLPDEEYPLELDLYAAVMGENDEYSWHWIVGYKDKFYYLNGGCDYTGWDCRSWGAVEEFDGLSEAIAAAPQIEEYTNRPVRRWLHEMALGERLLGVVELPKEGS